MRELNGDLVDLIYLDPPFFSQKQQKLSDAGGNQYEFSDSWNSRDDYLEFIEIRLLEMRRILKDTGNLFLHCDASASHYLKIILDEVFGEENFRSEIIWTYKRWSNSQKGLLPNHQTIFYYTKSDNYKFNKLYGDYSATTNIDQILQQRERNSLGKAVYKRDEKGEPVPAKEKKGVPLPDVWEIPFLNPKAKERTGYPTQKPLELLERIIRIGSDEGDLVLDPFCGSGTAPVCAKLLGRNFIGIDVNPAAIELTKRRLSNPVKSDSALMKKGIDSFKTKTEEELSILRQLDCDIVWRNKGIDALLKKHYLNAPVAVRIQKPGESLKDAVLALDGAGKKKKCSFTVLLTGDGGKPPIEIPENMVLIPFYRSQINEILRRRIKTSD